MNLTEAKILLMVVILLMHFLGLLPSIKCGKACLQSKEPLRFLNCLSAGIFLAMAVVHMLPEAIEIYSAWAKKQKIKRVFPLPSLIFLGGYLLLLAFDKMITSRLVAKEAKKEHKESEIEFTPFNTVDAEDQ